MKTIVKHLVPNVGALIIVSLLFVAQSVGALPGAAPGEPLAASQPLISYQGTLTDKSGNPLNQTVTMEFALYDALSGGTLKWGPETQIVQVSNGLFHVLLGSVQAVEPANLGGDLYLNVKVNGENLTPRELMGSVLYSVSAERSFSNFIVDGNLGIGTSKPQKRLEAVGAIVAASSAEVGPAASLSADSLGGNLWTNNAYDRSAPGSGWTRTLTMKDGNVTINGNVDVQRHVIDNIGVGNAAVEIGQHTTSGNLYFDLEEGNAFVFRDNTVPGSAPTFFSVSKGGGIGAYGTLNMNGHSVTNCGAFIEANLQTSQELAAKRIDRFEEGDVLCWGDGRLEKCAQVGDPLVQAVADANGRPIVMGAELVKVVGPVKKGDFLVASDVPGYAMAASSPAFGTGIAQALEDFEGEQGIIKAMIRKM